MHAVLQEDGRQWMVGRIVGAALEDLNKVYKSKLRMDQIVIHQEVGH